MKIHLRDVSNPRVNELIDSNNMTEVWKDAISKKIEDLDKRLKKLEDTQARKRSNEF